MKNRTFGALRRLTALILVLVLSLSLAACGAGPAAEQSSAAGEDKSSDKEQKEKSGKEETVESSDADGSQTVSDEEKSEPAEEEEKDPLAVFSDEEYLKGQKKYWDEEIARCNEETAREDAAIEAMKPVADAWIAAAVDGVQSIPAADGNPPRLSAEAPDLASLIRLIPEDTETGDLAECVKDLADKHPELTRVYEWDADNEDETVENGLRKSMASSLMREFSDPELSLSETAGLEGAVEKTAFGDRVIQYLDEKWDAKLIDHSPYAYMNLGSRMKNDGDLRLAQIIASVILEENQRVTTDDYLNALIYLMVSFNQDTVFSQSYQESFDHSKTGTDYLQDMMDIGRDALLIYVDDKYDSDTLNFIMKRVGVFKEDSGNSADFRRLLETDEQYMASYWYLLWALKCRVNNASFCEALNIMFSILTEGYKERVSEYSSIVTGDTAADYLAQNSGEYLSTLLKLYYGVKGSTYAKKAAKGIDLVDAVRDRVRLGGSIARVWWDMTLGYDDLANHLNEAIALSEISLSLSSHLIQARARFESVPAGEMEDWAGEITHYADISEYLVCARLRGEYIVYAMVTKDGKLQRVGRDLTVAEQWYSASMNRIRRMRSEIRKLKNYTDETLYPAYWEKEILVNTPLMSLDTQFGSLSDIHSEWLQAEGVVSAFQNDLDDNGVEDLVVFRYQKENADTHGSDMFRNCYFLWMDVYTQDKGQVHLVSSAPACPFREEGGGDVSDPTMLISNERCQGVMTASLVTWDGRKYIVFEGLRDSTAFTYSVNYGCWAWVLEEGKLQRAWGFVQTDGGGEFYEYTDYEFKDDEQISEEVLFDDIGIMLGEPVPYGSMEEALQGFLLSHGIDGSYSEEDSSIHIPTGKDEIAAAEEAGYAVRQIFQTKLSRTDGGEPFMSGDFALEIRDFMEIRDVKPWEAVWQKTA